MWPSTGSTIVLLRLYTFRPAMVLQLALHAFLDRAVLRNAPALSRFWFVRVLLSPHDVETDAFDRLRFRIRFTAHA
jgi:hypothetical protein